MIKASYYDMHIHLYEYKDPEKAVATPDTVLVAVSDDLDSLMKTIELSKSYDNVIPCAGYHPWNFRNNGSLSEAEQVARLAYRYDINCVGEVGLDKKFVPRSTLPAQVRVLKTFLDLARETNSYVTIHSPNAWRDVLTLLVESGVEKAMFHWYTGPLNLIDEIVSKGYYISINPAIMIQEKHVKVAEYTPLEYIVFESDGPYVYREMELNPGLIPKSISIVAGLKQTSVEVVRETAARNSIRLLYG
ncbi:MAG: TatD family hydrolase [Desulfurococcales archaeon]|nr:TatD family hydrolase [Desulfurococcales archaeon]MCE4628657.1 TatD family hydrolase [Desulfurococcales archaeon]